MHGFLSSRAQWTPNIIVCASRLDDPGEAAELGLEEAFAPDTVTLVEWPEKLPGLLPPDTIHVEIEGLGEGPRRVTVHA